MRSCALSRRVDRSLRHKVLSLVGESHRQLARRQLRLLQSQLDDLAPDLLGDAVPDAPRPGRTLAQSLRPAGSVKIVPAVKRGPWKAELLQGSANRQVGLLDQADDLGLFGCGVSHAASPPSPIMLFLSRRFSRVRSATTSFKAEASRRRSFTSSDVAARAVSRGSRFLPASRKSFDQP